MFMVYVDCLRLCGKLGCLYLQSSYYCYWLITKTLKKNADGKQYKMPHNAGHHYEIERGAAFTD